MILTQLLNDNYSDLNKVAFRITGNGMEANDLLTETYLNLHDKKVNVPEIKNEFIKFFSKCMSNRFKWPNSSFNKLKPKEILLENVEYIETEGKEPCKECMFNEIDIFKNLLPPHEKSLFELHFEDRIPCRMIAKELSIEYKYAVNPRSIERLILPIKKKIKDKWKR